MVRREGILRQSVQMATEYYHREGKQANMPGRRRGYTAIGCGRIGFQDVVCNFEDPRTRRLSTVERITSHGIYGIGRV